MPIGIGIPPLPIAPGAAGRPGAGRAIGTAGADAKLVGGTGRGREPLVDWAEGGVAVIGAAGEGISAAGV